MRFDDRLATALGQPAEGVAARQAVWRQLVDLLGEPGDGDYLRDAAFDRLREWRAEVPIAARQNAALLLLSRSSVAADLVEFFAEDATSVAAPLLAGVNFRGKMWRRLIPRLSPVARALLRHRRDLPNGAIRALEAFGATDLVIEGPMLSPDQNDAQPYAAPDIRELRARIDAFRESHAQDDLPPETEFAFESDAQGVVRWCDAVARGAIVGLSIADTAPGNAHGVDGHVAGAFRARAPFRDGRLTIARSGPAGGAWSISAVPLFDPATGRFVGYRGTARRPRIGERAEGGLLGSTLTGDSLRQLAHEVRTPLNAIAGFAEMIERQMLGPAPAAYRQRAAEILNETRQLDAVLEDLQEAAAIESAQLKLSPTRIDCALLLARITTALGPEAAAKDVRIALSIAADCGLTVIDAASAERMIVRLLSAAIGLARSGERIHVDLSPGGPVAGGARITVTRPAIVAHYDEQALLNACDIDGEEDGAAPALGLGFALRLVRSLAEASGGRLTIEPQVFCLELPVAGVGTEWGDESGACQSQQGSAIAAAPGGACSSTVEPAAHNGLVGGSNPSGPTTGTPA